MGIVADTSVFTNCERMRWTPLQVSSHLANLFPQEPVLIPALALTEMVHGVYRSKTREEFQRREEYVRALHILYSVVPFTEDTAWIAGKLTGEQTGLGNTLPRADALIAASALELSYAVLTHNVRDFTRIPNLRVIPFVLP